MTEAREYLAVSSGYRHIKSSKAGELPVHQLLPRDACAHSPTGTRSDLRLFGPQRNGDIDPALVLGCVA